MCALTPMLRRLPCATLARVTSRLTTATCRQRQLYLQPGQSLITPAPRGLVSSVTQIRYHSHHAHELNPPPCGVKLSPEQPMNHEFHRHSTRYSRTSREVLEALDKNWMDQPHYEPITWQLGLMVGFVFTNSNGFNHGFLGSNFRKVRHGIHMLENLPGLEKTRPTFLNNTDLFKGPTF